MMHTTDCYDDPTIAAWTQVEDRLRDAARAAICAEAAGDRPRHALIARVGSALVRAGAWLQAMAATPATMEETVQW